MIIDDVNANLVSLSEIVRKAGYIARPVKNVRQAVNAIETMLPNLILMDISMPDIDGFVFCSMLKKNITTKEIPVIFVSAMNSIEHKSKGFRAGAVDYITKPFDAEEVALRVQTHLKLYKAKNELEENNTKLYTIINDQMKKVYDAQRNAVSALVKLVGRTDTYHAAFYEHVAKNCRLLSLSLQLSSDYSKLITFNFIDAIELSAPLFDIGRLFVKNHGRNNIFTDDIEFIKSHTTFGAAILDEIYLLDTQNDFIGLACDIAKYHHENWDGTGYPEGKSGTDIPLGARIVAIISTFNMLIGHTFLGKKYSRERTLEYINERSGSCFDPDIINVFNKIYYQLKY